MQNQFDNRPDTPLGKLFDDADDASSHTIDQLRKEKQEQEIRYMNTLTSVQADKIAYQNRNQLLQEKLDESQARINSLLGTNSKHKSIVPRQEAARITIPTSNLPLNQTKHTAALNKEERTMAGVKLASFEDTPIRDRSKATKAPVTPTIERIKRELMTTLDTQLQEVAGQINSTLKSMIDSLPTEPEPRAKASASSLATGESTDLRGKKPAMVTAKNLGIPMWIPESVDIATHIDRI